MLGRVAQASRELYRVCGNAVDQWRARRLVAQVVAAWEPVHKAFLDSISGDQRLPSDDALVALRNKAADDPFGLLDFFCVSFIEYGLAPPLFTVNKYTHGPMGYCDFVLHLGSVVPEVPGWGLRLKFTLLDVQWEFELKDETNAPVWPTQRRDPQDPTTFLTVHNLLARGAALTHAQARGLEPYFWAITQHLMMLDSDFESARVPLHPVALAAAPWQLVASWNLTRMVVMDADPAVFVTTLQTAVARAAAQGVPTRDLPRELCLWRPMRALTTSKPSMIRKAVALLLAGVPVQWLPKREVGHITCVLSPDVDIPSQLFWRTRSKWTPARGAWALTTGVA
jgi:hypothetical protein